MKSSFVYLFLSPLTAFLILSGNVIGQHHHNSWFKTTFSYSNHSKWIFDLELMHRRQNNLQVSNPFKNNLTYAVRPWIHYQFNKNIRFSWAPLIYFANYRIIQKNGDDHVAPVQELRTTLSTEMKYPVGDKIFFSNRFGVELRHFNNGNPDVVRPRNKTAIGFLLTPRIQCTVFDEIFLNLSGSPVFHLFDQNRTGVNCEYKMTERVKLEVGYLFTYRRLTNSTIHENNLLVNLFFDLSKSRKASPLN